MKTIKFSKGKKLAFGLIIAMVFAIAVLALGMPSIMNATASSYEDSQLHRNYSLRYFVEIDGIATATDNLNKFLENTDPNTPIEVFFELTYNQTMVSSMANAYTNSLDSFATQEMVDVTLTSSKYSISSTSSISITTNSPIKVAILSTSFICNI